MADSDKEALSTEGKTGDTDHGTVDDTPGDDTSKDAQDPAPTKDPDGCCDDCTCAKCCIIFLKIILFIIFLPVFLAFLIVTGVVWILTTILKCCSPCCSPCFDALTTFFDWLVIQLWDILRWTCHRPPPPEGDGKVDEEKGKLAEEEKPKSYGTPE